MFFTISANATQQSVSGDAIFSQKLVSVNGQDMDQTYGYVFEGESDGVPMPEGSVGNKFIFSMSGNTTFPVRIAYTNAGVFKYKAYMQQPASKDYYTYDETVYYIEAHVTNVEPDSLQLTYIYLNKDGEKLVDPSWTITMDQPLPPEPSPVPDYPSWWPTQTLDLNYFFAAFGFGALIICGVLYLISSKKEKKKSNN